ncbi:MAG: hypothetical protein OEZ06_22405 [Myxococcales bacterium]|nr:hypothetical protein [Myxococcales bacterium]
MTGRSERYLEELAHEFPRLRLRPKADDRLSQLIDRLLRLVTFGGQRAYLDHYLTTLGSTIYLPRSWEALDDASRYIILRHEAVHLRQFRRFGWVGMTLLYLLPLLPLGLAYGRARLEWEAYAETLRATAEVRGLGAAHDPALHARIVRQFTSGAYGYMWPFPGAVRRWIAAELARLEATP